MSKSFLAAAVSLAALSVSGAFAADLPSRKEAPVYIPPPPMITWTGIYAGLNLGGGWSASSVNPNSTALYVSPATGNLYALPGNNSGGSNAGGVVGGGQIGYNYQINQFLIGAETDIQGTSMSSGGNNNYALYPDPLVAGGFLNPMSPSGNRGVSLNWFGTLRGRVGYLFTPTLLLYGTGGFAYGGIQAGNFNNTRTGWTAGGGVEWMFMPNWSAKAEYLYTDLSSGGTTGAWGWNYGYNRHPQYNVVRAGVNYHFNFGGAAPVVAKY